MLKGKHIVLGITGGIAAYKATSLARLFVKAGAEVKVVMTPSAKEFITPLTLSTLTSNPVISEFFTRKDGSWNSHVDLGLWADAMVIAPATASTIAKMTSGVADNMLVTTYLSAKCPVFIAPSMDLDMYAHPSTQRNMEVLRRDGVHVMEAAEGFLASHLIGKGRMQEPEEIYRFIESQLTSDKLFAGKKVLVTAGPTFERIDPVRFVGNFSSGKMGFALAESFAREGAEVSLIAGPVSLSVSHPLIHRIDVESALDMYRQTEMLYASQDILVFAAAVADYRPEHPFQEKIKREKKDRMSLSMIKNPDIAASIGARKEASQCCVGFALETNDALSNALAKLKQKNMDLIVLNSLSDPGAGFAVDTNKVSLLSSSGLELELPLKTKKELAHDLVRFIHQYIHRK